MHAHTLLLLCGLCMLISPPRSLHYRDLDIGGQCSSCERPWNSDVFSLGTPDNLAWWILLGIWTPVLRPCAWEFLMRWPLPVSHFKILNEKQSAPLCVSTLQVSSWQWSFLQHVVVLRQRTGWRRLHSLRRGSPAGVQKGDQQCAGDIITHILELGEGSQPGKLMKTCSHRA